MSVRELGENARGAAAFLNMSSGAERNRALSAIARFVRENASAIIEANAVDMKAGESAGLSSGLLDRLMLNEARIEGVASAVEELIALPDPVGRVLGGGVRPNGLSIEKISVPIGVIGVIYEARPNVTVDAAALCLKSGNAVILRGGREAINSNTALWRAMTAALASVNFPESCIQLITDTSRASADELMGLTGYVDALIPRGGAGLIRAVVENSKVPVIETGAGVCHAYIDDSADTDMAAAIVFNAKCSRPSVCNALECLLVSRSAAERVLPAIKAELDKKCVELRGDEAVAAILPDTVPATDGDWGREYMDYILAVRVVDTMDEAIEHIARYGTRHSELIITEDYRRAEEFLRRVDAAAVYVNASTRFTDGGEFGMGAEIGISTQKLHARGPLGLEQLTTFKYLVRGDGQIR